AERTARAVRWGMTSAGLSLFLFHGRERQINRLFALGAQRDGFGEFHVRDAGGNVRELNRAAGAAGIAEFRPNRPAAYRFVWVADFGQLRAAFLACSAVDAVLREIVVQDAFGSKKADVHAAANGRGAAEVIAGAGAVGEHGQDLHAVRRANRPAHAALRID